MKFIKYVSYQIFIIIFLLLILDFLFGKNFFQSEKDNARIYHNVFGMNLKPNVIKKYKFSNSDPPGIPIKFCTDQNAFRFSCEVKNLSFEETYYDIVFLGDSIVESTAVNFENSFSGLIQDKYNKKILNMGVNGYGFENSYTKINYFLKKGLRTKKAVMFITSVNDFNQFNKEYKIYNNDKKIPKTIVIENYNTSKSQIGFKSKLRKLFPLTYLNLWKVKSYFYPTVKNIVKENIDNLNNINYINFNKTNESLILLNRFNELLKEYNIELYFVIFPNPGNYFVDNSSFIETMDNFCKSKHCKIINLFDVFFKITDKYEGPNSYKTLFLENDDHFNIKGHKLVAGSVYDQLFKF